MAVFISYRRSDAEPQAIRLYEALADRFGAEDVVIDLPARDPRATVVTVLQRAIGSCDAVIALIGRRWDRDRLHHPDDCVRLELEIALASPTARVIPALVENAEMPSAHDLPPALAVLSRLHAVELAEERWHYDVERLIRILERQDA